MNKKTTDKITVKEPKDWALHSAHGFMRCGPGEHDKLVRLHSVAAWLMRERELPLASVVDEVCRAIEKHGLDGVHILDVHMVGYACPAGKPTPFDQFVFTDAELAQPGDKARTKHLTDSIRAVWLRRPFELERLVNNPEYPVVYDSSTETPFEFAGRRDSPLGRYAVTFEVAHELWGWGTLEGAASVDSPQPATVAAASTAEVKATEGECLLALLEDYEKRGTMTRHDFATTNNLSVANLKKRLSMARTLRKKSDTNHYTQLVVVAGKKVAKR